ncbi:N-acetylmuramoyl-L-alanine amidase [Streptomyces sp. NPDC019443]|uniref:N-acetylmuramoyl-L-alanine amidase n=1 Tax=Streptomyces sp. NPDC019443 TaxID=3365061 RepID=UPI00378D12CA
MSTPLSADQLVKALRDEGLTVVEIAGWRTHNRNHKGPFGPVHGVMIHHTVTSGTSNSVALCYNGHSDLPGPLCHGVIDKQGRVHLVGNGRANHAGSGDGDVLTAVVNELPLPADNQADTDGNRYFYGFECINLGDGKDPWPEVQLLAIEKAAAAICRAHEWSERSVIGHLEWQPGKIDPRGFTMQSMRARVADRLQTSTTPLPQEDDMALTAEEHRWLAELRKFALDYHGKLADGTDDPRDVYDYIRGTARDSAALKAQVSALTAANKTLVDTVARLAADVGDLDPTTIVRELTAALESVELRLEIPDTTPTS